MDPITLGPLAVWVHQPKGTAKGRVLLIHGLSEHSGRHLNTVEFLVARGWEVTRFDLRGSGRSGGRRQYIEKFSDYVDDATRVYNWMVKEPQTLPVFVLGHSLGGAIALHFAAQFHRELAGLVLSAPAYKVGGAFPPIVITVGKILSNLLPTFPVPGSTKKWVSRDPEAVEAYARDPLSTQYNTLRQGAQILDALENVPDCAEQIQCPVLLAHGSLDHIVRMEGSFEILTTLASDDREMFVQPGGYHEPHNDYDKELYFAALGRWLETRAVKNGPKGRPS